MHPSLRSEFDREATDKSSRRSSTFVQNAFKFTRPGTTVTLRVGASASAC